MKQAVARNDWIEASDAMIMFRENLAHVQETGEKVDTRTLCKGDWVLWLLQSVGGSALSSSRVVS